MEAYKVWVTLNLQGDALKKMEQFTAMTKKAMAAVERLNLVMKPKIDMFDKMAVNVRELNPQLSEMARNINNISRASGRIRGGRGGSRGGFGSDFVAGMGFMSPGMMFGTGALFAGGATLRTGWHQGAEYSRGMGQLSAMGYSPQQLAFARQSTSQASMGITQADKLEALVDAQMATQSFTMAKALAPIIAQNKYTSNMYGGMSSKQVADSIRAAEMIGGSNPDKVAQALTSVMQMTALSGGSIMPNEQRAFMRQAAGAASRLTPMGYLALEPIMQEYGGSKTGTALTTGLRAFSNPQISHFARYQVDSLKKFGLWDNKSNRMRADYLNLIQTDPTQFAQVWLSNLAKKGVTSDSDVLTQTMSSFPRTFGTLMSLMIKNMDKITRERAIISGLPAGEGMAGIYSKTQGGAQLRLSKAFESFTKSINDLSSPTIISGMNAIAALFEGLANFISKNENAIKFFSKTFLSLTPGIGSLIHPDGSVFNKTDPTKGSIKPTTVTVNNVTTLDGKVIAKSTANHMSNATQGHQLVQHGTSAVNPVSSPISPGMTFLGGFG